MVSLSTCCCCCCCWGRTAPLAHSSRDTMQARSNYGEGKAITAVCVYIYSIYIMLHASPQRVSRRIERRGGGVAGLGNADGQALDIVRSTSVSVSIVWPFSLYLSLCGWASRTTSHSGVSVFCPICPSPLLCLTNGDERHLYSR